MDKLNLKALYRDATRGLPQYADRRVDVEELLSLARGESLGARMEDAIAGIAASSDQARALQIAAATRDWSEALAADLARARRPSLARQVASWLKAATLPPVFAACAISLLAVAAWRVGTPGVESPPTQPPAMAEIPLFHGDFDGSVAHQDEPDQLFGGDFDS